MFGTGLIVRLADENLKQLVNTCLSTGSEGLVTGNRWLRPAPLPTRLNNSWSSSEYHFFALEVEEEYPAHNKETFLNYPPAE